MFPCPRCGVFRNERRAACERCRWRPPIAAQVACLSLGAIFLVGAHIAYLLLTKTPTADGEWLQMYVYIGAAWTASIGVVVARRIGFRGLLFVVIGSLVALSAVFLYVAFGPEGVTGFTLDTDSPVGYRRRLGLVLGIGGLAFFLAAAAVPHTSPARQVSRS